MSNVQAVTEFRQRRKENLIRVLGSCCCLCGYDKCIKALEFHHLDPSKKDFTISNDHFRLKDAVEESKKCILLCANCHRELHDNLWNIEELNKNIEERDS